MGSAAALTLPLWAPLAHAQDASDVAAARTLGIEGVKLADAGKCDEALEKLSRAEKLHHAPTVLERLGECQINLGKVVDGTESLNRVIREDLGPSAPAPFVAAKVRAQKAFDAAKGKVAKLVVSASGPAQQDAIVVKIDGQSVSSAYLGVARPTDPGEHTVEVSAPGYKTATKKVTLTPGGNESTSFALEVDPAASNPDKGGAVGNGGTGNGGTTTPPPVVEQPSGMSGKTVGAIVSLTVGGLGVGTGAVFGLLAMGKKSSLDGTCVNKACPPGTQGTIDTANTFALVSTIGFIAGGVGLAAGIVFLALPSGSSSPKSARIVPLIGPDGIGVAGQF